MINKAKVLEARATLIEFCRWAEPRLKRSYLCRNPSVYNLTQKDHDCLGGIGVVVDLCGDLERGSFVGAVDLAFSDEVSKAVEEFDRMVAKQEKKR